MIMLFVFVRMVLYYRYLCSETTSYVRLDSA
jgi:hypothetical protein